jgi:hypothetical protein
MSPRYLLGGSMTILWSLVVFVALPDSPGTSHRWFNEEERAILIARMRGNLNGASVRQLKWYQIREALCDYKIWLLAAMGAATYVTNGGVAAFGSVIIRVNYLVLRCWKECSTEDVSQSFGYSSLIAILLQAPGGASGCLSVYIVGYLSVSAYDSKHSSHILNFYNPHMLIGKVQEYADNLAASIMSAYHCGCHHYLVRFMDTSWPCCLRVHSSSIIHGPLCSHNLPCGCKCLGRDEESVCHSCGVYRIQRRKHYWTISRELFLCLITCELNMY